MYACWNVHGRSPVRPLLAGRAIASTTAVDVVMPDLYVYQCKVALTQYMYLYIISAKLSDGKLSYLFASVSVTVQYAVLRVKCTKLPSWQLVAEPGTAGSRRHVGWGNRSWWFRDNGPRSQHGQEATEAQRHVEGWSGRGELVWHGRSCMSSVVLLKRLCSFILHVCITSLNSIFIFPM